MLAAGASWPPAERGRLFLSDQETLPGEGQKHGECGVRGHVPEPPQHHVHAQPVSVTRARPARLRHLLQEAFLACRPPLRPPCPPRPAAPGAPREKASLSCGCPSPTGTAGLLGGTDSVPGRRAAPKIKCASLHPSLTPVSSSLPDLSPSRSRPLSQVHSTPGAPEPRKWGTHTANLSVPLSGVAPVKAVHPPVSTGSAWPPGCMGGWGGSTDPDHRPLSDPYLKGPPWAYRPATHHVCRGSALAPFLGQGHPAKGQGALRWRNRLDHASPCPCSQNQCGVWRWDRGSRLCVL